MNILITSGGTTERIDEVRAITNTGTGTLGAMIADRFKERDESHEVIYVCGKESVRPTLPAETFIADDTAALEWTIREICESRRIDVVIHAMAVSDYRVKTVTDSALLAKRIAEEARRSGSGLPGEPGDAREEAFAELILNAPQIEDGGKIRSDHSDLVVVLERTPKIIGALRELLPEAVIVGFKLLVDASQDELLQTGLSTLKANNCDYVLANDMRTVTAGKHTGFLIDKEGAYTEAEGKDAIAELIVSAVTGNFS
ncbi:MAG: phosphopantothenate--cysteine ligase [Clostridiales Family XIII bacterium]|jgi:phosphopantothenate-cysteine ligase|nr:phosphopantothenate--cysteine ligase [Clostridiales Family XIII bacterium]